MSQIETIYNAVLEGDAKGAQAGVNAALAAGINPDTILKDGLIAAMGEVGRLFEENEYFVPEMLVAARAMQGGLALLKPHLAAGGSVSTGKAVVGTVKGDLHDIGKNLVAMMLEGAGFEVVDLGTDVSPEKFVAAVREHQAQAIAMSALLTTTMPSMSKTIQALEEAGRFRSPFELAIIQVAERSGTLDLMAARLGEFLEDQEQLFKLLVPGDIGVELTEGWMMDPEASVSALVFHHPQAMYFSVADLGGDR